MHDQLSAYGIGDDWNAHIARGSAGGVDFLTPVGTPIEATEDGYVSFIPYNGTGGHTVTLIRDGNHSTQFMHLSSFGKGGYVSEYDIIGYTGGAAGSDGAGSSTGPHCHAHSYDFGVRVPPFFLGAAAGVGGSATPGRKKAPEMIGYNYNVEGSAFGAKVLADPVSMTYRYPTADERSAFEQSGGAWVSLNDAMWNAILGRFREIKKPDAVGGSAAVDLDALATKIAPLVKVDYPALAKAVNDDAARRLSA